MKALPPARPYTGPEFIVLTSLYNARAFGVVGGVRMRLDTSGRAATACLVDEGLVGVEIGNTKEDRGQRFYYLTTKGKREAYRAGAHRK